MSTMSNMSTSTVHFSSTPEIVLIPRRSLWQRKFKPLKDKCCSVCYIVFYVFCYPCIQVAQFCISLCKDEDDSEREVRPNYTQKGEYPNLYEQGLERTSMIYEPKT